MGKNSDKKERGVKAQLQRQQLHLQQWTNMRQCMFMMDKKQISESAYYDMLLKVRDGSMVLLPWKVPDTKTLSLLELQTLNCLQFGGLMDATFTVGRQFAWRIMEGLSADWYLLHSDFDNKTLIPHNPEQ